MTDVDMKLIAAILIFMGIIFTAGMFYIIFTVEEWFDIIIGWLFLGPLPLFIGAYILKKIYFINFFKFFNKTKQY